MMNLKTITDTLKKVFNELNHYQLNIRDEKGEHLANIPGAFLLGGMVIAMPVILVIAVLLLGTKHKLSLITDK